MLFFAIDTSSETLSLAVYREGTIFRRDIADAGSRNAELALPAMHALLAEAQLALSDLTAIVAGIGPGSFTGVRIACGIAQGLSYGAGLRAIVLPSTLAVAAAAPDGAANLLVAIDARMQEVYWATYCRDESAPTGFRECTPPALAAPPALTLPAGDDPLCWHGIGSAFADAMLATELRRALSPALTATTIAFPSAAGLAAIAARLWQRQGSTCTVAPHDVQPLYLRDKVALTLDERRQRAAAHAGSNLERSV